MRPIRTEDKLPPVGKVVLCFFFEKSTSMAGTRLEIMTLKFGSLCEDGKYFFKSQDMGIGIRGTGWFSASHVRYWADIQPPQREKIVVRNGGEL